MIKITVEQCKKYSKSIKSWFKGKDNGTAVLYYADGNIDICDYLEHEKIKYESKNFEILFVIDGQDAAKKTAEQLSYDIYSVNYRNNEDDEKFLTGYIQATSGVYTITEAAEKWNKDTSTIRKAIAANKLEENIDYRKAGKVYLVTKKAMERLYGKIK